MKRRLILVAVALAVWMTGIGARLYYLQVEQHEYYRQRAVEQQRRVLDLEPPRGTIYDSRGRVLAVSLDVETAWADPRQVEDPDATARSIAGVIAVDVEELAARLALDREFVFVARKLDRPHARALRDLDLPGVSFLRESKRYYPMRELAAPVLGFVGTDHSGLAGLEARYDRVIGGRAGRRTVLRDAHRHNLLSPRLASIEAEPGMDLHLTLDATVQHIVERELARAVETYGATRGTVVVLDPLTGAIRAMASAPTFDPNRFGQVSSERWRNIPVMDAQEPGSTFKMITTAAILEHGLLAPDDELECEMGGITLAGRRIRDHHPFGRLTVREVLAKSSNVGVIKMGLLLGDHRLHGAISDFGFGRPTGIDLPGESAGIVRPVDRWAALSKAYIAFGQGVSVTALQLARAFAAVANGGDLVRPHVVAAVAGNGVWEDVAAAPFVQGRAITPETAAGMRELLTEVVRSGTGRAAAIPGYRVAGKTGTAQKVVDGRYSGRQFVASFVGMAPVENPVLVMAVVLDEPWPLYHGGQVAAPTFAAIAGEVVLYWGARPSPEIEEPEPPREQWQEDEAWPPPLPVDLVPLTELEESGRRVAPAGAEQRRGPGRGQPGDPTEEMARAGNHG